MSATAKLLSRVQDLIDRGAAEFEPGYEHLPETQRPIRLTDLGYQENVLAELRERPMSATELFPLGMSVQPVGGREAFLLRLVEKGVVALVREEPLVVRLPDDDRRWWEPR